MDDTTNQAAMPTDPTPAPTPDPTPAPTPTDPTPPPASPTVPTPMDQPEAPVVTDISDVKLPGEATPEPDTTV